MIEHFINLLSQNRREEAHNFINNLKETETKIFRQINSDLDTALLLTIHYNMYELALKILNTHNAYPEYVDSHGNTALTLSIKKNMEKVSLKIIE